MATHLNFTQRVARSYRWQRPLCSHSHLVLLLALPLYFGGVAQCSYNGINQLTVINDSKTC